MLEQMLSQTFGFLSGYSYTHLLCVYFIQETAFSSGHGCKD